MTFVMLSVSEPTLAACAETACRLCHARRRSTSAAQLRICFTASSLRGLSSPRQSEQNHHCHSEHLPIILEEFSPRHSEEVARPTKNLIQSHSERSKESISTLNLCERLAALFSFSRTFLRKKVPKNLCTVKMAASVFGRSLSGHGRLTLFRTPAPGAHSLDGRNPAISTSAEQRFKCPPQKTTVIPTTYPSFCGALSLLSF